MSYAHWVTQSRPVFSGPGLVSHIVLTATAGGAADITLYDGTDDAGKPLVVIRAPASSSRPVSFGQGLPVEDGLFIKLGTNVEGVLILWAPAE